MATVTTDKPAAKNNLSRKLLMLLSLFFLILVCILLIRAFPEKEREYVAISVYFSKTQAEIVQSNLSMPSMVLEKTTENLYFKTKKQKQKAKRIIGAFSCLKSCIGVLNGEIERLESGATQQSSKRILSDLRRQFAYLAKEYQKDFVSYAFVCEKASAYLLEITDGTVYVGDLRYLLCALCNSFVDLSKEFSL